MILRTSLFNRGIYKSVLKRFWWVMIVHLLCLQGGHLLCDIDVIELTSASDNSKNLIQDMWYGGVCSIVFSIIIALFAYQSIHSKKQAIFIHSLPISKEANFISSALAGLTMLIIPIIINGLIMLYCELNWIVGYYTAGSAFIWVGMNLLFAFIMFAYVTLAAVVTGNGAATVVLSVVILIATYSLPTTFELLADKYLLGYEVYIGERGNLTLHLLSWLTVMACRLHINSLSVKSVEIMDFVPHIAVAVILYITSFVLYRKRKLETAGEAAGFNVLKPILKYLVTFLASVFAVNIFFGDSINPVFLIIAVIMVSAVVYFGIEMAINKTLRVLKSYKGYLVFVVVMAVFTVLFTNTSFFGYETRVPDVEDIENVALYDYNETNAWGTYIPYVENEELKQFTTELHKEIIENNMIVSGPDSEYYLKIKYRLKNGRVISRKYGIDRQIYYKAMDKCYEYEDWRVARHKLYKDENFLEDVKCIGIGNIVYLYGDDCQKLLDLLYQDAIELHDDYTGITGKSYDVMMYYKNGEYVQLNSINNWCENTVAWLTEIGEWQKLK